MGLGDPAELTRDDFELPSHRLILAAIHSLKAASLPAEPAAIAVKLQQLGHPEALWSEELGLLPEHAGVRENFPLYRDALRRERRRSVLKDRTLRLLGDLDAGATLEMLEPGVSRLGDAFREHPEGPSHLSAGLPELFLRGPLPRLPLGLDALDPLRIEPGDLAVIAARPRVGKTAMLATLALAAAREGWQAIFLSLEMPAFQIRQRLFSAFTGIPLAEVKDASPAMVQRLSEVGDLPIWIDESPDLESLAGMLHAFTARNQHPTVLFLDYLQLLKTRSKHERRYEVLGHICRELKTLAKSTGIPIVTGAQLSRAADAREIPQLSDLRESGEIEQTADQVLLMYRDYDCTHLKLAKYRNGEEFKRLVRFLGPCCTFEDYLPGQEPK